VLKNRGEAIEKAISVCRREEAEESMQDGADLSFLAGRYHPSKGLPSTAFIYLRT